jgi:adenosine deaminase
MSLPLSLLKQMHKAELHCHLDGSIRVNTLIELAKDQGVTLPTYNPQELAQHVILKTPRASLPDYLSALDLAISVMQV